MQGQVEPPILIGQARKLVFNNLPSLFVYANVNIEKTQVTLS